MSAEQADAADHRRGDRLEQERAAADVGRRRRSARDLQQPADRSERRRQREDVNADAGDVDARAARSLGAAADGIDVAPELGVHATKSSTTASASTMTPAVGTPRDALSRPTKPRDRGDREITRDGRGERSRPQAVAAPARLPEGIGDGIARRTRDRECPDLPTRADTSWRCPRFSVRRH